MRLVGSVIADEGEFPYIVSIRYNNLHSCGGALISPDTVLTAAHCLQRFAPGGSLEKRNKFVKIVAGTSNLKWENGTTISVAKFIPHPDYYNVGHKNDIGIIKVI